MSEKCAATCSWKAGEFKLSSNNVPIPSSCFAICSDIDDDVRAVIGEMAGKSLRKVGGGEMVTETEPETEPETGPSVTGGAVGVLSPRAGMGVVIATLIVVVIICAVWYARAYRKRRQRTRLNFDRFYTLYAEEQPTRPYVPYVGTIPYGTWGVKPWAMAFDLEPPSEEYSYLPSRYRDPTDIL